MSARGAGWGAPAELGIARQGHGQASDQFYMWALAYVHPQPNGVVIELASQQTIGLVSAHALPNPKVGAGTILILKAPVLLDSKAEQALLMTFQRSQ